jgi:CubicO group peptidase (beta-lactamase class C family)
MKKYLLVLFMISALICQAQQKTVAEKDILLAMDKTASDLLKNSKANSVSIGIVKEGKIYTNHYGEIDKGKGNTANNNTVFEIASITKLFTGLLVTQAVLEKKISLDDDIRKYITGSYPNLEYQGTPITIRDLVSFKTAFNKDLPDTAELRKNFNDTSYLAFKKLDESYSREKFFADLKNIKLDTLPGTKFKYSNGSIQLTAHILENVYHKSYESLLKEKIFNKLGLNATQLNVSKDVIIANGYNAKNILMPKLSDNLWGAAGYLKSSLGDLVKFITFELDTKNKIVAESQRNLYNSNTSWNGYFWDYIMVDNNGQNCRKHGGAFSTQNMMIVYPERKLGISVIVNISDKNTSEELEKAIINLSTALLPKSDLPKEIYGYKVQNDNVVFTYKHDKRLNPDLVKSVNIAGSFEGWNPRDKNYQMIKRDKATYELSVPKSRFEKDKTHLFKFVINSTGWAEAPENAINKENGGDNNLILKI